LLTVKTCYLPLVLPLSTVEQTGPLEMSDLAGNDISWFIRKARGLLDPAKRSPSERYCELGDTLCEAGRFGQKAGKGWYKYDASSGSRKAQDDPEVPLLCYVML
jgi:3-hydroxyacyl-CoA dehydrogenase